MKNVSFLMVAFLVGWLCSVSAFATTYYYKTTATSNPALNTNWTTSSTGIGGTTPTVAQFNAINNVLNLFNTTANVSATLIGNWTTLGSGTVLNVGTGARLSQLDFVTFTFNRQVNVGANGTVISSSANPTFFGAGQFIYNAASTTIFSANGVNVPSLGFSSYGNLTLSGTSATLAGKVSVAGTFTGNNITMNGQELDLAGTITSIGTVTGDLSASIFISNGQNLTLNLNQTSPGTSNALNTLSYDDGGAGNTLVLGGDLNIAAGGVLQPASGTIDASGATVTLLADQTGLYTTGSLGDLTNGTYIGNITSNVYHDPAGNMTDWTLMGSPGINDPTNIFTAWNASFPITCPNCPDGSTVGGVGFTSITFYDEATSGYPDLNNITDPLNPGIGVWVYQGNSSPGTPTFGELITVSGPPATGNIPVNVTGAGDTYNLLANPYPSAISWNALYNNGANAGIVGSSYLVWSPNNNGYSQCDDQGVSNPSSGSYVVGDAIPTGQGFYVTANGGGGMFNFDEIIKLTGASQALLRQASQGVLSTTKPTHFNVRATGNGMTSEAAIKFVNNATPAYDQAYDSKYWPGTAGWLALRTTASGNELSINGMPPLNQNYSIPLLVTTGTTGVYAFDVPNLQYMPSGACLMLHDNYTSNDYDLRNGPHSITINDTETVARFAINITITSSTITATPYQASCAAGGDGYIVAVGTNAGPWNFTWKDANSNIIRTAPNKATADTLAALSSGTYWVDVNTVGSCDNATQGFTLSLPAAPTSAFSVNTNTVFVNNSVNFTNNSLNADAWYWDFGDSAATSTMQNPVYTYTNTGTFNAILYAINTACGDTAVSQFTEIEVLSTTGIASRPGDDVIVTKDAAGAFVKFNYGNETRVGITVYNALGQVLYTNGSSRVSKDKIYLDLGQAREQVVFISIVNFDNNTQVTKKLFND